MKKRIIALTLLLSVISLSSCGNTADKPAESSQQSQTAENKDASIAESPLEILTSVWNTYEESEKFPAAGGDFSEENSNQNGPGRYSVADADALDSTLCFPSASASKLEDAASLVHMMNLNTFTSAVFRVKPDEDVNSAAEELSANVKSRQWMCGMPDKFEIFTAGNDIIFVLGETEIVDTFCSKIKGIYPEITVFAEENITA